MTVAIYGPMTLKSAAALGYPKVDLLQREPWLVDAASLGEALAAYEQEFGARFRPYDGSLPDVTFAPGEPAKYFFLDCSDEISWLVDVHIQRGREQICPKQDLSFPLAPDDEIHIGPLAC